jgi:hypothetical protein
MRAVSSVCVALVAAILLLALPVPSHAQISVGVSIRIAPPVLPVYVQPVSPGDGYLWTPGYWAWGPDGYFWVPGTWVRPPQVGLLWTPGYWGWGGGIYAWRAGYWGPHVGFYGGVNYGFGYVGVAYAGGFWNHGVFNYNRTVNNVDVTVVHNTFNKTVINNTTVVNRVSYNGGTGGIAAQPTPEEQAAGREQHIEPTGEQTAHEHAAGTNRAQLASVNHGQPGVAATGRPGEFSGKNVVAANRAGGANGAAEGKGAYRPPSANASGSARNADNSARPSGTPAGQTVARNEQSEKPQKKAAHKQNKPAKDEHGESHAKAE